MGADDLKRMAAEQAVEFVRSGMALGLGSGSTALLAIRRLGELLRQGQVRDIVGVPTSEQTAAEARRLGIPLTDLEAHPTLDLTIDGADEVDPHLNLIKGGGGALLREKIVAQARRREIIVVDSSKLSPALGTRFAVPVEVIPFGCASQAEYLRSLGAEVLPRRNRDGSLFATDHGNYILDCRFGPIADPEGLASRLKARAGIVEHGLFLGLATDVIVASQSGISHLTRPSTP